MKLKTMTILGVSSASIVAAGATFVAIAESSASKNNGTKISKFENLLDSFGVPVDFSETSYESRVAPFADLGSWHAFALPDYQSSSYWGGFTQPLIVRKNTPNPISKSLDILTIDEVSINDKGKIIPGTEKRRPFGSLPRNKVHIKQYPGGLWQEFEFESFTVQLNLRFVQNKTSFVKYKILNKTSVKKAFKLNWHGELFKQSKSYIGAQMTTDSKIVSDANNVLKNKYGQPLARKTILNTQADEVLYATKTKKGILEGTNSSSTYAVAIGKNGQAPDSENKWRAVGPRLASKIGNVDFATNITNKNGVLTASKITKIKIDPAALFTKSTENNKLKNTLTVNFNKPTFDHVNNFLGHDDEWKWQIQFQKDIPMEIKTDGGQYQASTKNAFIVEPNKTNSLFVGTTFTFTAQERMGFTNATHGDFAGEKVVGQQELSGKSLTNSLEAEKLFKKSEKRWLTYINNMVSGDTNSNFDYQKVAIKGMETLVNNWRGSAGMLEHQGVTPSISVSWFNQFWSWDTWKQATAEVNFDPKLAIDNVKVMFDFQVTRDPQTKAWYHNPNIRQKNDVGMIPDNVAYWGGANLRDTKPPLSAWSVYNILNTIQNKLNPNTKDPHTGKTYNELAIEFGKYMYNRIAAYHAWWYSNRDGDHNGVNEYGATIYDRKNNSKDKIIEAAAWESGMDNAPRFDRNGASPKNQTTKNFDNGLDFTVARDANKTVTGYVLQQESADLNSYMYAEKGYMIKIAQQLEKLGVKYSELSGNDQNSKTYKYLVKPGIVDRLKNIHTFANTKNIMKGFGKSFAEDIKAFKNDQIFLGDYINNYMFDKKTGFFYDLKWSWNNQNKRVHSNDMLLTNRGAGPEGFIPLWAQASTKEHAQRVRDFIMSPNGFNTYMPFPSAAYNNPKFAPDKYWRGPVWLDQAYFGVQALEKNGFHNDATYMVDKLYRHADGLMDGAPIRENYNPLNGKGLSSKGFSWSSGMYMLMYKNFIKAGK